MVLLKIELNEILPLLVVLFFHFGSGQKMLEDFQEDLRKEKQNRDEIEEKLDKLSKVLLQVKAGVDHLADKLSHLKTVSIYSLILWQLF